MQKNTVHTNEVRAQQIQQITQLAQRAGMRELKIILAFIRNLLAK